MNIPPPMDPSLPAREAAFLGREIIDWVRLPVYVVGVAWLVRVTLGARVTADSPGPDTSR